MGKKFNFLQKAIELFPDAIVVITRDGTITAHNMQFSHLFGYRKDELLGKDSCVLLPQDFHKKHKTLIKEFFKQPKTYVRLDPYKKALNNKKECLDIEMAISPYESDQDILALIVMHNISDKVEVERRILQSYKHLKAINLELEKFAHIISHDLKAPLNRISSLSQLLMHEIGDEKKKEVESITDYLDSSIASVKNLIYGILEYSKAEEPEKEEEETIDFYEVFEESQKLVSVPEHFSITLSPNLPQVKGNPTKMLQVFLNLISNAIKYNDKKKGALHIHSQSYDNEFYVITFDDNGPGVPKDKQEKIFQLFEKTNKMLSPGSHGLGLSIVKRIVEQKGGKVWCTDSPKGGASFNFTWPKY